MRLLEEDHALSDPPRELILRDQLQPEHLPRQDLAHLGQVPEDHSAIAVVPGVNDVQDGEDLRKREIRYVPFFILDD